MVYFCTSICAYGIPSWQILLLAGKKDFLYYFLFLAGATKGGGTTGARGL